MHREDISALLLCGGRGARLGGVDKPMLQVGGRLLVEHAIAALAPQVSRFVLSCGRDASPYEDLGYPAVGDLDPGQGPLGGIASALPLIETDWILTHPGDAPFADPALVERLAPAARVHGVAVPHAGGHRQNLVLLISRPQAAALARFYETGGRAVKDWLDAQRVESVDMSDVPESFFNVNTADDLAITERRLAPRA